MKTKLFIIIPLIFLLISSCKKHEDNELPPATQSGANTFGCKINGVNWVANGSNDSFYPNATNCWIYVNRSILDTIPPQYQLSISAYNLNGSSFELQIGQEPFIGTYNLNTNTSPKNPLLYKSNYGIYLNQSIGFTTDSLNHYGYIKISKYDKINFILSGEFQFDAIDNLTKEVIHITEGRFDLRLGK